MRRISALTVVVLLLAAAPAHASLFDLSGKEKKAREAQEAELKASAQSAQAALEDLQKKYKELEIDRNNVLAQTKQLISEKSSAADLKEKQGALEKTVQTLMTQKDRLLSENQKLKKELASIAENHDRIKDNFQELQVRENAERQEVEMLREQMTRRVESAPQYLLLQNENRAIRQEGDTLKQTVAALDHKLKKALEHIRKIQDRDFKYVEQLEQLKGRLGQLTEQNKSLTETNRELNKRIDGAPGKVGELAKQNEQLIRETAQMHYNMGVLFTESQKFDRAIKEFEKAVELDPNDQRSHYNLGYIYAEQVGSHDKAMQHFRRFLELDPESKQAESVKSYLVTQHTYQGKTLEKGNGNPF